MIYGGVGLLLVTAATGYWVLERADTHRGSLKKVGRFVGSVIIIVSLLGVACRVWAITTGQSTYHKKMGYHSRSATPWQAPASTSSN